MSSAVRFKGLLIRRMPGFPSGGPALDFSGRDVNVIYGPNASGKTTAARALQALLWPRAPGQERWSVTGCFQIGDAAWTVDLEAGFRQVQCDGRDAAHPVLSPLEYRDRYRLGLQELMAAEDQDLAEIIRRESAGGYDLGTAAADLGFADRIPRRGPESQSLDQARQQVRMAQQNQRTLRGRQDELAGLKVKEKQAIEARRRIEDLKLALERVRAAGRVEAAEKALGLYPPAMEKLAGNEIELLEAVRVRLTRESEIRAAELDRLDEARRRLEDAALPAEGVPDDLVPTLRRRIEELDRAAVEIDRLTQDLVRSRARAEQERSRLDGSADPERLARIDIEALGDLAALARRADRVRGDRAAARALEAWLGPEEASPDLETLREGWRLLSRWLSDPDEKSAPSGRRWLVFLAGAVASAGAVLAWRVDFDLLLLSALGLLLLWPAVRPPAGPSSRQRRAADFEGLGLRPPDSWTPESVLARTDEFRKAIGAAGVSMERAQRWSDLGPRREKLERDLAELDRDREDIVSRLGLGFDLDEAGLFLLAEGLRRWQEARARVSGAEAALGQAQNRGLRIQADLEKELAVYRYPEGGDRVSIGGRVEDLGRRVEMRRLAVERIREAERKRVELDDRLRSLAEERDRIFSSAGLEPGAESELRRLLELRPSCIEAAENLRTARYDRDRAESALDGRPELTRMSESDIRSEIERCRRLDEALAGVSQTIGQITEAVDQAGRGHDLEEALALEDDCRARLETARERDLSSAAGWLLSRHLERENQDRHLPEVFHRARDLFARLTQGRYELDLDLGRACFRARDTVAGLGCDLEALSGATRLHLLLAVRMAFVESREQGPRLPLLLDETLANSDPERAEAVIDAAAEFCRQGRQV
ncbi:MAG: AAA family ATPase, partial [Proteobacteria bacterium]|nr:AAA family ATPase [Pseudomonadota bacterium]